MTLRPDNETPVAVAPDPPKPSPWLILFAFGGLNGTLAAGYGVLFTIVDDYKTEYGIDEAAIGVVIGPRRHSRRQIPSA